jgi:hypothetical protein
MEVPEVPDEHVLVLVEKLMAVLYETAPPQTGKRNVTKGKPTMSMADWYARQPVTITQGTLAMAQQESWAVGWNYAHKKFRELLEGRYDSNCPCPECQEVHFLLHALEHQQLNALDDDYVPLGEEEL